MNDTIDDDSRWKIGQPPRKRTNYILPTRQKVGFQDGLPKSSRPTKSIRDVLGKLQDKYKYTPLGPDEDIRVLVVEPGTGRHEIRCWLMPTRLPTPGDASDSDDAMNYEALSYFWGPETELLPITIYWRPPQPPKQHQHLADVVLSAVAADKKAQTAGVDVIQRKFYIRRNLYEALLQLRDPNEKIVLWVDAICINQEDIDEKTVQVSKMHQIYSNASNVCIWLGVGEFDEKTDVVKPEANKDLYAFMHDMLDLYTLDKMVQSESRIKDWRSFVELMRNRWFSRRWVIQELALAKEATVHYGAEVIGWIDFADAVSLFVTKHDQINSVVKRISSRSSDSIGDIRVLGANTLALATSNLFRRPKDGRIMEHLKTLENLVSTLLPFEATDPRDTVYGVLSIAKDTPYPDLMTTAQMSASMSLSAPAGLPCPENDPRIMPSYDKTLAHVCADFVSYCIDKSQSLDIICRHWAPLPRQEKEYGGADPLPCWVSSIEGSAFGTPETALEGRQNGDSLVGSSSGQHKKNYNASAGLRAFAEYSSSSSSLEDAKDMAEERTTFAGGHQGGFSAAGATSAASTKTTMSQTIYRNILTVQSRRLDTIGRLSPRAADGMILHECLIMAGWGYGSPLDTVPDSLWCTLVADRGPHGDNVQTWYRRVCIACLARVTRNGDFNTSKLMTDPETPSTMVEFLRRVQSVVWNRKFLRSRGGPLRDQTQLLGLAPRTAEEGDHICILFGCSVPVILREKRSVGDVHYEFIGEAYIHDMMDGEALSEDLPEYPYDADENVTTFKIL